MTLDSFETCTVELALRRAIKHHKEWLEKFSDYEDAPAIRQLLDSEQRLLSRIETARVAQD